MPSHSFEEQLAQGRQIEKEVAAWLMARGSKILPVYPSRFVPYVRHRGVVFPELKRSRK